MGLTLLIYFWGLTPQIYVMLLYLLRCLGYCLCCHFVMISVCLQESLNIPIGLLNWNLRPDLHAHQKGGSV